MATLRHMATRRRANPPQLRVVFDANAIFNQTGHYLLKHEVYELITTHAGHADVQIAWYLPEVVRHEREYQMLQQGMSLLPAVQKLERVLGHNLNITEQIVRGRITDIVEQQLHDLRLNILPLDPARIDWRELMLSAAYRRPPFSATEKEKGFRDALLLEAFAQLVEDSPQTARICRLVLVSADQLLGEAVSARTADRTNVKILPSLDELKGLINTLVSEVTEEFVAQLRERATAYFYSEGDDQSLYLREKVGDGIRAAFGDILKQAPEGTKRVELETVVIGTARFKAKAAQRVTWVSRITFRATAFRFEATPTAEPDPEIGGREFLSVDPQRFDVMLPTLRQYAAHKWAAEAQPAWSDIATFTARHLQGFRKIPVKKGEIAFEVTWSVTVSANRQTFSGARVDEIRHVDSTWQSTA